MRILFVNHILCCLDLPITCRVPKIKYVASITVNASRSCNNLILAESKGIPNILPRGKVLQEKVIFFGPTVGYKVHSSSGTATGRGGSHRRRNGRGHWGRYWSRNGCRDRGRNGRRHWGRNGCRYWRRATERRLGGRQLATLTFNPVRRGGDASIDACRKETTGP
jgi:hypothetical protein